MLVGESYQLRYLTVMPEWLLGAAFLVAVFSGAIVVVAILRFLISIPTSVLAKRRFAKWKQKHALGLHGLPPEELYILAWAAQCGTQVFLAPFNHERLEPLIAKRYVEIIGGQHSIVHWPYRIPDHIWERARQEVANLPPEQAQLENPFRW